MPKGDTLTIASAIIGMLGFMFFGVMAGFASDTILTVVYIICAFGIMCLPAIVVVYFGEKEEEKIEKQKYVYCSYCGAKYLSLNIKCPNCGGVNLRKQEN